MRNNKKNRHNTWLGTPYYVSSYHLHKLNSAQKNKTQPSQFETIESYYGFIETGSGEKHQSSGTGIHESFAVFIARVIIQQILENDCLYDNGFDDGFYQACLENIMQSDYCKDIDDNELVVIYIKQCVNMLKAAEVIQIKKNMAHVNRSDISAEMLFYKLYNSFWNLTPWEDIFPSDEDAARELKKNRSILVDLLLSQFKRVKLDTLANDFFDMTGFSIKNDLVMISFLDFYFFTWLKHFGIVRYIGSINSPVYIELTEKGKRFLSQV